jgi:hypothetical protein
MTQIVFLFTIKLKIAHLKGHVYSHKRIRMCVLIYMTDSLTVYRRCFPSSEEINGIQ